MVKGGVRATNTTLDHLPKQHASMAWRPPPFVISLSVSRLAFPFAHGQTGIVAAEAHRIRQGRTSVHLARNVGDVIEIAVGVGVLKVDGRRQNAVAEREYRHRRLDGAGGAERVPDHRLD